MIKKKWNFEAWNVAIRKHEADIAKNHLPFVSIPNLLLFWAADPFILYKEDKYYIFAELYNRILYKGKIGYCVLSKDGRILQRWRTALRSKGHLSFPYLYYSADGSLKMMPESSQESRVSVYVPKQFPHKWSCETDILRDIKVADSVYLSENTILTYDNLSRPRELLMYVCGHNGWEKVQAISDPEICLRPGGSPFSLSGKTYLPVQDSEGGEYGKKLKIVRVSDDFLNKDPNSVKYVFTPENIFVKGEAGSIVGVHTYNFDGEYEVIDYKTFSFNCLSALGYIFRKIRRYFRK